MDCKRIQDMILTDYTDGEENEDLRFFIKNHLDRCRECKEFEKMVHEHTIDPFKAQKQAEPPPEIWSNIRAKIEAERGFYEKVIVPLRISATRIAHVLTMPRMAAALATVAVIFLFVIIAVRSPESGYKDVNAYLEDTVDFIANLDSVGANGFDSFDVLPDSELENFM